MVVKATKFSNPLPDEGEEFGYFSSYPGFKTFRSRVRAKLNKMWEIVLLLLILTVNPSFTIHLSFHPPPPLLPHHFSPPHLSSPYSPCLFLHLLFASSSSLLLPPPPPPPSSSSSLRVGKLLHYEQIPSSWPAVDWDAVAAAEDIEDQCDTLVEASELLLERVVRRRGMKARREWSRSSVPVFAQGKLSPWWCTCMAILYHLQGFIQEFLLGGDLSEVRRMDVYVYFLTSR